MDRANTNLPNAGLPGVSRGASRFVIAAMILTTMAADAAEARGRGVGWGVGAAVLGIIAGGALLANQSRASRPRPRQVVVQRRPRVDRSAQVAEANRLTQKALAALGFYTGAVDGKMSADTKTAIVQFQGKMGEKPTGNLTGNQRKMLMASYAARLNNAPSPAPASVDPLFAMLGAAGAATGVVGTINAAGAISPAAPQSPAFFKDACMSPTQGAGGLAIPALSTSNFSIEQICAGRTAMWTEAAETLTSLGQVDIQNVRAECRRIATSMADKLTMLSTDTPAQLAQKMTREFAAAGDQRESVVANFKVCLGAGYVEDMPDVVLASGLALVGNGQPGYAEAIAGVLGVGQEPYARPAKAAEWFDFTAQQIEKGAAPVKTELGAERAGILRSAAQQLRGKSPKLLQVAVASPNAAPALPLFSAQQGDSAASRPAAKPQPEAAAQTLAPVAAAPAPAAMPAPAVAAVSPVTAVDARQAITAQANAYFDREIPEQSQRLETLVQTLGLDKGGLPDQCGALLKDDAKPEAGQQASMMLRLCRSWSYSVKSKAQMYAFDQKLAAQGDADASTRVLMHQLVGNDKTN